MAKWFTRRLDTSLSVEQCAHAFRSAAEASSGTGAKIGALTRKLRGQSTGGFYTPDSEDDPFAQFDRPSFTVGVHIPKYANNDVPRNIQMSVWDRDGHREVELATNRSAQGLVDNFIGAIRSADPTASEVQ